MRDRVEFALYWSAIIFFSMMIAIPMAAAFIWMLLLLPWVRA